MVVSGHVKNSQEISFTKGGTESGWPFIRFKLASYVAHSYLQAYMFGTTTKLSMLFQVLGLWLHGCTLERILFLELGSTSN